MKNIITHPNFPINFLAFILNMPIHKKSCYKALSSQKLANLYTRLAKSEEAGIPLQKTITIIMQDGDVVGERVINTFKYIKSGKSLAEAGVRAGLFVGIDAALVKVAEASGTNATVFHQLAQFYYGKAKFARQVKSQLILPLTILLVSIFIQPIPALLLGTITIMEYVVATLGLIFTGVILIFGLLRLPQWVRRGFLRPMRNLWDKLAITTPFFGQWYIRRSLRNFMQSLGLMVQAGLPILEALPLANEVVENLIIRKRLQKISSRLRAGDSFADAFSQVREINTLASQLIISGEHSGSLAEMMLHYAKLESDDIAMHEQALATWIPRLIYFGIMLWIAYGIVNSATSMMPNNI